VKDLKHLFYFEKLLDDANNELVREAQKEGRLALGYTCYHMPEVLLNLGRCFSIRLRAPRTGSMEMASYYMSSGSCEYSRALLERGLEGGYHFLDAIAGVDACEAMNRAMGNMELLQVNSPEKKIFFYTNLDVPCTDDEDAVAHLKEQVSRKVLTQLHEKYDIDVSDASLIDAVNRHNEICRLFKEMDQYRHLDNPTITGYEFAIFLLASYVCPKDLMIEKLKETCEELKTRVPDKKKDFRIKAVVVGSEIDDLDLIKLFEENGIRVVCDRYCYGNVPGRQEIILNKDEDILTQIVRNCVQTTECPRQCIPHKVKYRFQHAADLVKEYNADGIIYEQMKFCTYWSYERILASHVLRDEYHIPTLSIDRPYRSGNSEQLRTRVQAFVENVEIKKIKAQRAKKNEEAK
jgi:benzoyl-CoA reductase/2-hydroxyglutaryl-CoA dehydratase subunit BcrC/BadD/HgdB